MSDRTLLCHLFKRYCPLGLPLATEVLPGQRADDPLYLPAIARVRTCLNKPGLLYVGDCKMGALDTRASIQAHGDYYLCPLSALQVPAALLAQQVEALQASHQPLLRVERTQADGRTLCIAQGYERIETVTAQLDGVACTWTERLLLVQSVAAKLSAEQALHTRLKQAQQALSELLVRRQGKAMLSERTAVEQAVADTLAHFRVDGLLLVTVTEQVTEQALRAYRGRRLVCASLATSPLAVKCRLKRCARRASSWDGACTQPIMRQSSSP